MSGALGDCCSAVAFTIVKPVTKLGLDGLDHKLEPRLALAVSNQCHRMTHCQCHSDHRDYQTESEPGLGVTDQ